MAAMDQDDDSTSFSTLASGAGALAALPRDRDAALSAAAAAAVSVSRADFIACIDRCVRFLAASLKGTSPPDAGEPGDVAAAERASTQLWRWLHADRAQLDDGTPITFAVFDTALQRVGERLPRRGMPGQEHLLRAACLLAEVAHAPAPAPITCLMPAA
jgi:hypothetical protein